MAQTSGEEYYLKKLFEKTKIGDVMKTSVITIYEDDELSDAEKIFVKHSIYYIPVVNRKEQLVGLISRKYLYKTQSPRKVMNEEMNYNPGVIIDGESYYSTEALDGYILRNVMKRHPFVLNEKDSLADAVLNMSERNVACIPIIDNEKKVVGIFSSKEIIDFTAKAVMA